jgi:cytochrome c oxidase subunit II
MIETWVVQASTYAASIDGIIALVGVLVGFWFLVAEGVFFWLIFRFRARDGERAQYITGEEKKQMRFISWPHYLVLVCDVFIVVGAVRVWVEVKQYLPSEAESQHVRVVAQQWAWSFVHPGADAKLDTADDIRTVDELHVQVGQKYIYELESRDVLHDFSVPVFRLKQDAIPGRVISGWFEATRTGTYDIQCAEICGIGHGMMAGRIVIESPEQHAAWVAAQTSSQLAANLR